MRPPLFLYQADPSGFAREVLGFEPDEAQSRVLEYDIRKGLLCCTRGFGKTEITAVLAAWHFAVQERALILVVSETAEKAAELVERAREHLRRAGFRCEPDTLRKNGFRGENGSRMLPVPSRHGAVRGYPATMILVDEAAVVPDKVWTALSGTRASTFQDCRLWVMSTPGARAGFFYELWMAKDPSWTRIQVPATECPRIAPEFLEEMRRQMRPEDFRREFLAEFGETSTQLFSDPDQLRAIRPMATAVLDLSPETRAKQPWLAPRMLGERVLLASDEWTERNGFILAGDLGQARDHSALAVLEYRLDPLGWKDPVTLVPAYEARYVLRWLERVPLDTTYTDLAGMVEDIARHREMEGRLTIVLDAGGVGRAFLDQLRARRLSAQIVPVQLTMGARANESRGFWNVPKHEPVLALEQLFREGRLAIPAELPALRELQAELRGFERRRSVTGRASFSGKTAGGGTDDLVIALALGAWMAGKKLRTAGRVDEEYAGWRRQGGRPGR